MDGSGGRRGLPLAFLPLALTYLATALNMTVASIALPTISTELSAESTQLVWLVNITPIASAALILFAGSWGDRFGRKRLMVAGIVVFMVSALLSAVATNMTELILLRAVTGVGSALTMPAALALTFSVVAEPSRRTAVGIISSMQAVGSLLGPVLAGALLLFFWWGAAFLSVVPFLLLALVLTWWKVPSDARRPAAGERLDVGGATLMAAAAILLLVAAVRAASPDGLADPVTVVVALAGIAAAILLVWWERRCPDPIFLGSAMRSREFVVPTLVVFLVQFVLGGVLFANTQYVQLALGFSAFAAGAFLLPALTVWVLVSASAGLTARRFGVRAVSTAGLALSAVGLLLVGAGGLTPSYPVLVLGLLLLGCMGVAPALMTHMAVSSYPPERRTVGSAINSVAMRFGLAFGIAAFGSALAATYSGRLAPALAGLPPAAAGLADNSLGAALQAAGELTGEPAAALAQAARLAFADGYRVTLVAAAVVQLALSAVVFLASPSRRRADVEAAAPAAQEV